MSIYAHSPLPSPTPVDVADHFSSPQTIQAYVWAGNHCRRFEFAAENAILDAASIGLEIQDLLERAKWPVEMPRNPLLETTDEGYVDFVSGEESVDDDMDDPTTTCNYPRLRFNFHNLHFHRHKRRFPSVVASTSGQRRHAD